MRLPTESDGHAPRADEAVVAHVMHASPGRLRVRVDRAGLASPALGDAERALAEMRGVLEVRRNPSARSITVRYDPKTASLPAMLAAVSRAGVTVEAPSPSAASAAPYPGPTDASVAVATTVGRADRWIAEQTGGKADLRTLVPLGLAILAAREVIGGRAVAVPWYALAWYAFDSFQKFQGPDHRSQGPASKITSGEG